MQSKLFTISTAFYVSMRLILDIHLLCLTWVFLSIFALIGCVGAFMIGCLTMNYELVDRSETSLKWVLISCLACAVIALMCELLM